MIQDVTWRLRVWRPTGEGPTDITADDSVLDERGLTVQVYPEGDQREWAMHIRGVPRRPQLGITSLSAAQFQVWDETARDWVSYAYGQVRIGGNQRNPESEDMVLRSLLLRLNAVALPEAFSAPQQPAHLTVLAAVQAVQDQLAGLILIDPAQVTDLGFDLSPIIAAYRQTPGSVLDKVREIGQGKDVDVRMGVNADRTFYCRAARDDVLTLTADDLDELNWKEPVAEDMCTEVLWHIARRDDQSWVTHRSRRMTSDPHGVWLKQYEVSPDLDDLWLPVPVTVTASRNTTPWTASDLQAITDGRDQTTAVLSATDQAAPQSINLRAASDVDRLTLRLTPPTAGAAVNLAPAGSNAFTYGVSSLGNGKEARPLAYEFMRDGQLISGTFYPAQGEFRAGTTITLSGKHPITVSELRPERVNRDRLDQLARILYRTPSAAPAELVLRRPLPPAHLAGRVRVGDYEQAVEVYEYRLTDQGGFELAVRTGQPDDPLRVAAHSLVKARDQRAVITALTANR